MTVFYVAQVLGIVSFGLGILCFYQKDDRKLKIIMLGMQVNNVLHFGLLGAWTASMSSVLSVARTGLALRTRSRRLAYLFIVLSLALGVGISDHWTDFFPIVGSCFGTYALFCLSGIRMRMLFTCGAFCWLINNILVGSIGGTLLEITLLIVNFNTMWRIYKGNKNRPASEHMG
jgi:hypothetical protein